MDKLRAAYRVAVIIGLAIMASLLVSLAIVGMIENQNVETRGISALSGRELEIIKFVFFGISGIILFLIRFLNRKILNLEAERKQSSSLSRSASDVADFSRLTTAAVITYALCETPAVFGLVLYFLGKNTADFYLFLIVSLFFFATNFPKFSMWEAWYRQQTGAGNNFRNK